MECTPVLSVHLYSLYTCTLCTPVLSVRLYSLYACTLCTPVLSVRLYSLYACTLCTPVLSVRLYSLYACTLCTPVPSVHLYSLYTCTLCTPVLSTLLRMYARTYVCMCTCYIVQCSVAMCYYLLCYSVRLKAIDCLSGLVTKVSRDRFYQVMIWEEVHLNKLVPVYLSRMKEEPSEDLMSSFVATAEITHFPRLMCSVFE